MSEGEDAFTANHTRTHTMTTDYRLSNKIRLSDLIDGRLEQFGVREKIVSGETTNRTKRLTDGHDDLLAFADRHGFVKSLTRCGDFINGSLLVVIRKGSLIKFPMGDVGVQPILEAIEKAFDTNTFSEFQPEYWGYGTQEEWNAEWESIRNERPEIGRAVAFACNAASASDPNLRDRKDELLLSEPGGS
jgi:hypothetical protein